MATIKVTFTIDAGTLEKLEDAAGRLERSKSEVVRDAIAEYHDRLGRLTEKERVAMLRALDELVPRIPRRSAAEVKAELEEIRRARRQGGRRAAGRKRPA